MTALPAPVPRPASAAGWLTIAWFGLVLQLAWAGVFAPPAGTPPVELGLAAGGPPVAAVVLLARSRRFRAWARSRDLGLLTALQAWRLVGLAFLALVAVDRLPAGMAVPAGLGDILVGLTAPFVAALIGRGVLRRSAYVGWTAFGVLDLVTAVALGVLYSDSRLGVLAGGVDTVVMSRLPMILIPAFIVPFLLVVHAISLVAVRSTVLGTGSEVSARSVAAPVQPRPSPATTSGRSRT
jgi:hypothetical protein